LCDFGLARGIHQGVDEAMTEYVVTRYYRAPEVMTNPTRYSEAIDVWSLGCVLGEMLGRKIMFTGNDYLQQLALIVQTIGTPSDDDKDCVHANARVYVYEKLAGNKKRDWKSVFPTADPLALDLLDKLLVFNPRKRVTVDQALAHPWFNSMLAHGAFHVLKPLLHYGLFGTAAEQKEGEDVFVAALSSVFPRNVIICIYEYHKPVPEAFDFTWEKDRMRRSQILGIIWDEICRYHPSLKKERAPPIVRRERVAEPPPPIDPLHAMVLNIKQ